MDNFIFIINGYKLYVYEIFDKNEAKLFKVRGNEYDELDLEHPEYSIERIKKYLKETLNYSNLSNCGFSVIYNNVGSEVLKTFSEYFLPCKDWKIYKLEDVLPTLLLKTDKIKLGDEKIVSFEDNIWWVEITNDGQYIIEEIKEKPEIKLNINEIPIILFQEYSFVTNEEKVEELNKELNKIKKENNDLKKRLHSKNKKVKEINEDLIIKEEKISSFKNNWDDFMKNCPKSNFSWEQYANENYNFEYPSEYKESNIPLHLDSIFSDEYDICFKADYRNYFIIDNINLTKKENGFFEEIKSKFKRIIKLNEFNINNQEGIEFAVIDDEDWKIKGYCFSIGEKAYIILFCNMFSCITDKIIDSVIINEKIKLKQREYKQTDHLENSKNIKINDAISKYKEELDSNRIIYNPQMDKRKFKNFRERVKKNTGYDIAEKVYLYYDDTFFGGGEDGFALTDSLIIVSSLGAVNIIELSTIEDLIVDDNQITIITKLEEVKFSINIVHEENRNILIEILESLLG